MVKERTEMNAQTEAYLIGLVTGIGIGLVAIATILATRL